VAEHNHLKSGLRTAIHTAILKLEWKVGDGRGRQDLGKDQGQLWLDITVVNFDLAGQRDALHSMVTSILDEAWVSMPFMRQGAGGDSDEGGNLQPNIIWSVKSSQMVEGGGLRILHTHFRYPTNKTCVASLVNLGPGSFFELRSSCNGFGRLNMVEGPPKQVNRRHLRTDRLWENRDGQPLDQDLHQAMMNSQREELERTFPPPAPPPAHANSSLPNHRPCSVFTLVSTPGDGVSQGNIGGVVLARLQAYSHNIREIRGNSKRDKKMGEWSANRGTWMLVGGCAGSNAGQPASRAWPSHVYGGVWPADSNAQEKWNPQSCFVWGGGDGESHAISICVNLSPDAMVVPIPFSMPQHAWEGAQVRTQRERVELLRDEFMTSLAKGFDFARYYLDDTLQVNSFTGGHDHPGRGDHAWILALTCRCTMRGLGDRGGVRARESRGMALGLTDMTCMEPNVTLENDNDEYLKREPWILAWYGDGEFSTMERWRIPLEGDELGILPMAEELAWGGSSGIVFLARTKAAGFPTSLVSFPPQ
jgi:hypothetical protein